MARRRHLLRSRDRSTSSRRSAREQVFGGTRIGVVWVSRAATSVCTPRVACAPSAPPPPPPQPLPPPPPLPPPQDRRRATSAAHGGLNEVGTPPTHTFGCLRLQALVELDHCSRVARGRHGAPGSTILIQPPQHVPPLLVAQDQVLHLGVSRGAPPRAPNKRATQHPAHTRQGMVGARSAECAPRAASACTPQRNSSAAATSDRHSLPRGCAATSRTGT
jgi:hypothetical protein